MNAGGDEWLRDPLNRRIIAATQDGLPLVARPYAAVAAAVGATEGEVMERLQAMLDRGAIRRLGAVPQHYALGVRFNAMTVWDVPDDRVDALGPTVGALACVSHCYTRPRHPPEWPYNLFAMVHGSDQTAVDAAVAEVAAVLGDAHRGNAILYSRRLLKKTGLRLPTPESLGPAAGRRDEPRSIPDRCDPGE